MQRKWSSPTSNGRRSGVFGKVRKDFDEKQIAISDHQLRRTMDELMAKAIEEIKTGKIA